MDPGNPNNLALKDVHTFTLPNDPDTVYYVKTRPHVKEFLQEVRKMYELHIYTMGTRSYADEVAKALDPEGSLFAGRVLSRDESGSGFALVDLLDCACRLTVCLQASCTNHSLACFHTNNPWSLSSMTAPMSGSGRQT